MAERILSGRAFPSGPPFSFSHQWDAGAVAAGAIFNPAVEVSETVVAVDSAGSVAVALEAEAQEAAGELASW